MHIKLTDDQELVAEMRQKLQDNDNYCPGKKEKNPETKCICKEFLESDKTGYCSCGLYRKMEL